MLNTYEIERHNKPEFARFLSLRTCRNKVDWPKKSVYDKVRLATLNFRRIFLTQRHVTVKVKLQIKAS